MENIENGILHFLSNWWAGFRSDFINNFIDDNRWLFLWRGFLCTLQITFFAALIGIAIGFFVAIVRTTNTHTGKLRGLNAVCKLYTTIIRGTPVVTQLMIIYYVVFASVNIDKTFAAIIAFGINSGAYVAEIVRSGIMSIDRGQIEAGRSLGFNYVKTMWYIVMPQAFKNILPALANEFIALLKETSVSGYIATLDLAKAGDIIQSRTYSAYMPLIAVALIYLVLVVGLTACVNRLERRLSRSDNR